MVGYRVLGLNKSFLRWGNPYTPVLFPGQCLPLSDYQLLGRAQGPAPTNVHLNLDTLNPFSNFEDYKKYNMQLPDAHDHSV